MSATKVPIKITPGHFATNHSHINYYVDTTTLRARQSEAQAAARALKGMYMYGTIVDTILCVDGTQVIGAYLAQELTQAGFMSKNAHKTIYIVTPESNSTSQLIFRDNIRPLISGKNYPPCGRDQREDAGKVRGSHPVLWRDSSGRVRAVQRRGGGVRVSH